MGMLQRHRHSNKDEVLTNYFDGRDIVRSNSPLSRKVSLISPQKFLVDNAESMKTGWYRATYLLETLVMKAFHQDPDGMDLNFTTGTVKVEGKDKSSVFVTGMEKGHPKLGVTTNMVESLSKIFNDYVTRLRNSRQTTRDATLIILTDGLWAGTNRKQGVKEKIIQFLQVLDSLHHSMKHRPFSIEFVQFGDDPVATRRLKHLDNFLRYPRPGSRGSGFAQEGGASRHKDMIDTERADGDVNKMLLGSFVEAYDDDDDEDEDDDDDPDAEITEVVESPGVATPTERPLG